MDHHLSVTGMLPLKKETVLSLCDEDLPANLCVADATLFPRSSGKPPILRITVLTKKDCIASLENDVTDQK